MQTMTITVPTAKGKVAYYKIQFETSRFDEVIKTVGELTNPSDVAAAVNAGEFEII